MEIQWPLILFTFFNCLAGGIFLMQGILTPVSYTHLTLPTICSV